MEFATPAVQTVYERIAPLMKELFGEFATAREEYPVFSIAVGSAWVQVGVYPWKDDDATVRCWSFVVTGAELTPDLMKYLLTENAGLRFGAFALDDENDILLSHSIVGSTCDKSELRALVMAIIYSADEQDDKIIARFGGQRAIDRGG